MKGSKGREWAIKTSCCGQSCIIMKEELTRKATIEGVRLLWPVAPAADNSAEGDGGGLRPNWYPVGRHGVEFRDDPTGGDGSPSRIVGLTSIIATEGKGVMPSSLSLAVV